MTKIERILITLKDLKEREKHMVYPSSTEYNELFNNRMEALNAAIRAIKAIEHLSIVGYTADLNTEYGKGFNDGVNFVVDRVDEVYGI